MKSINMAYVLTKKDLRDLLHECIVGDAIDDDDQFVDFINGIMGVVSKHWGGNFEVESDPNLQDEHLVFVTRDDNNPEGPTIYDDYDPDSDEAEESREFMRNLKNEGTKND